MLPKRTSFCLLASLLLHAATLAAFHRSHEQRKLSPIEVSLVTLPAVVKVEPVAPPQAVTPRFSAKKSAGKPIAVTAPRQLTVKDLTPKFNPGVFDPERSRQPDVLAGPAFNDPRSYMLSGDTYDAGNAERGFIEAIHARINNYLIFDSLLAQYAHFGTVYLEFEVRPSGQLIEESIRAEARDQILKVHVIRSALLPGLSQPLAASLQLKKEKGANEAKNLRLKARFEFVRSPEENSMGELSPQAVTGFALTFRRFTGEGPVAKNLGEQLTHGGVGYDLFAVYESWKKYNKAREHERIQYDPFAIYRADKYYN